MCRGVVACVDVNATRLPCKGACGDLTTIIPLSTRTPAGIVVFNLSLHEKSMCERLYVRSEDSEGRISKIEGIFGAATKKTQEKEARKRKRGQRAHGMFGSSDRSTARAVRSEGGAER